MLEIYSPSLMWCKSPPLSIVVHSIALISYWLLDNFFKMIFTYNKVILCIYSPAICLVCHSITCISGILALSYPFTHIFVIYVVLLFKYIYIYIYLLSDWTNKVSFVWSVECTSSQRRWSKSDFGWYWLK